MEIIYLLVPLAVVLLMVVIAALFWAVRSGQFDDLEGPAYSILMDDDEDERSGSEPGHAASKHIMASTTESFERDAAARIAGRDAE